MEIIKINGLGSRLITLLHQNIPWQIKIIALPPFTAKYQSINSQESQFGVAFPGKKRLKKSSPDEIRILLVYLEA